MNDHTKREIWRKARRASGLAKWERENRRKTMFGSRLCLAYRVPGTREAGQHNMMVLNCNSLYQAICKAVGA